MTLTFARWFWRSRAGRNRASGAKARSWPVAWFVLLGAEPERCPAHVTFALVRVRSERRGAVTSGGGARGP